MVFQKVFAIIVLCSLYKQLKLLETVVQNPNHV